MKRLPWLFLLGLFFVGCTCRTESQDDRRAALEEKAALKRAMVVDASEVRIPIPAGSTGDRIVNVNGPTTIYVVQKSRVLYAVHWGREGAGSVTVPVESIVDNAFPSTMVTVPGPLVDNANLQWRAAPNCTDCVKAAMHKCCI